MSTHRAKLIANRYLVERPLGQGGMGTVYLARDRLLHDELVAVKLLHRNLTDNPEFINRFLREMQTLRQVNHLNVVRIFDTGEFQGEFFYSMEYLQGKSLADLLDAQGKNNPLEWEKLCPIFVQILRGLRSVHERDIVHRDLKPDNLLLLNDNIVKLTDFGIVRTNDSKLTETQTILGTLNYIAPEMWSGGGPTFQTDIYALGTVFFEMLTGQVPFPGDNPAQVMRLHLMEKTPNISAWRKDLPYWVPKVVNRMLVKSPDERPKTVSSILKVFENPPSKPSPRSKMESAEVLSASLREVEEADEENEDRLEERLSGSPFSSGSQHPIPPKVQGSPLKPAIPATSQRTQSYSPRSSQSAVPVMRLELDSPTLPGRSKDLKKRSRLESKRMFRQVKRAGKGTAFLGLGLVFCGLMAFPRTSDWMELQLLRVMPKGKKQSANELGTVETFVAKFMRDRNSPDLLKGDYEILQRELAVSIPETENSFKELELPASGTEFLLSGNAVQMNLPGPKAAEVKKRPK